MRRPTRRELFIEGAGLATMGLASSGAPGGAAEPVYPDDAFSRPAVDRLPLFETMDGVGQFMEVRQRAAEYSLNEFEPIDGGMRWRFRSRTLAHNALFIQTRIRRAPQAISFEAVNGTDRPMAFSLQAHELTWLPVAENSAAAWTLGEPQRVGPGQRATLTFRFSEARSNVERRPRFPIIALVLLVHDLAPGVEHTLDLRSLKVHYGFSKALAAARLQAREEGGSVAFRVAALAGRTSSHGSVVDVEVRRRERALWRVRLGEAERAALAAGAVALRRPIPWYLGGGRYDVGLVVDGYRVQGAETALKLQRRTPPAKLPRAERRLHGGRPALFIDGRPYPWSGYSSYDYQPGNVAEFGASGSTVFCVPTCAGRHVHHVCGATWGGNYDELDESVCFSLQANPAALVMLRVSLALPPAWLREHRDDLARILTEQGELIWEEGNGTQVASFASEAWRADQAAELRRLLRHCKAQPWASRLAGIWLTCGVTEEWFAWACNDRLFSDYSAPMRRRFAVWLKERSRSMADAPAIPGPAARQRPGFDLYPEDADGRSAAAFHRFLSELAAETIGFFARVVKQETDGRTIVGCFNGYVIELAGEFRQATSGHFALRRLLDDPNVDMLATVPLLDYRDLTNGYNPYCSATESIAAAGKLFCSENDMFSWLHPVLWHQLYDPKDPRGAAISMHRRECANDAVHGTMAQKFSLAASWHHDAELHRAFAQQNRVYASAGAFDRTQAAEIAFVVDDTSFAWVPPETTLLQVAHKQMLHDLGRAGAPVGVWLLSDLHRLPERVKLVVVAPAPAARAEDLDQLRRSLEAGGRTFVVVGPAGLIDPMAGRWTPDAPGRLLGLPIRVRGEALPGSVAPGAGVLCPIERLRPRAEVDPAVATVRYADGAGAATSRALQRGGRLEWWGTPPLGTDFWRERVSGAGVHLFAPAGCFVHAARDLVTVTSPTAGLVSLTWPSRVAVRDLFDGWSATGVDTPCPFVVGQTRLFHVRSVGPGAH